MKKLGKTDIVKTYQGKVGVQDYSSKKKIDGVQVVDIKNFSADDGDFLELGRMSKGVHNAFKGFEVKQINYSMLMPGSIKAWHLHYDQEDVWFVPPTDRLLVGLVDLRANSETKEVKMSFVMGAGKSQLVYIPRGVAHGASNMGNKEARIIYLINNTFNFEHPDENRLPWDTFGKDFWNYKYE